MVKVGLDVIQQKRGKVQGNKMDSGGIEKSKHGESRGKKGYKPTYQ